MKTTSFRLAFLLAALSSLCLTAAHAASLTVTPASVSNTYSGNITLLVTGLTNGETVVIQRFLDANTNSVIDAGDILGEQFQLKDGQASTIGGVTNINVPGDTDSTAMQITSQLFFQNGDIRQSIIGKYLFKLSSPSGRFTPVTNLFTVTNATYAQSFTGSVRNSGSNVPNSIVILFSPKGGGLNSQAGTVANNSGSYTIQAPAGDYLLLGFKSNFVADISSAPTLTLSSSTTVTTNLTLTNATQNISGKIVDAANTNIGLGGFLVPISSTNNLLTIAFTDTNGNFTARVRPSQWRISNNSSQLGFYGYVAPQNSTVVYTSTGSVAGVTIALSKATALFYGSVKDNLNNPLPGVLLYGQDDLGQYESDTKTDQNGNYAIGTTAGTWRVDLDNNNPTLTNYVVTQGLGSTNISAGQAVQQNFVAKLATNTISGFVKDNSDVPVVGVDVSANDETGYQSQQSRTDNNGFYSFKVANGVWHVNINCGCDTCDHSLISMGYQCASDQIVVISNNNGSTNFTVYPCGSLQVTTTSLPGGTVNTFYSIQLQNSGCNQPFNWSLSPGSASLPASLSLDSNGSISGNPDNAGTFNFSVRVTDSTFTTADQALSLTIAGSSLQVTTTSLPNGTSGTFYSNHVDAIGGQLPYSWSLSPGSAPLPPGLNILANGTISGTPTNAGTFDFFVRVTDSLSATADGFLSITIAAAPLQIATLTLTNAQMGGFYSRQLQATGGEQPYSWTLAPGSAALPSGLTLATSGILSGTPTTNGIFGFIVRVTDSVFVFTNRILSLTINGGSSLSSPSRTSPNTNRFQFLLSGAAGQNYTLQASINLQGTNDVQGYYHVTDWFNVLITNAPANSFIVIDPAATNLNQRLYRVLVGP